MSEQVLTYEGIIGQLGNCPGAIGDVGNYVSCGDVSNTTGVLTTSSPWIPQSYTYYWPYYTQDSISRSFSIVKILMDKKLVRVTTIKQFVDLVDEVAKVL